MRTILTAMIVVPLSALAFIWLIKDMYHSATNIDFEEEDDTIEK